MESFFLAPSTRSRAAVIHYFFPAERSLLVEIVPGRETLPAHTSALMGLYEEIGKIPVRVDGRFGCPSIRCSRGSSSPPRAGPSRRDWAP